MAIDKTIPNRLQADADQRLVRPEVGEMLDAQNVTMAESGGSSSGVIKNVRGTIAGTPLTASDRITDDDPVTVIGSVSDSQRDFVYWFVADINGNSQDAIYQYNTSDDTYRLVLKNSGLNFDSNGFVKADVVNAAFQQDGVVQTVLYFTDNVNPPRKINVDRAMNSSVYDSGSFDTVISTCKPAMQRYPTVSFTTDQAFEQNNFKVSLFQFAVQQIYIDGEESAISAYSELAVSNHATYGAQEGEGYGVANHIDNVCEIVIPVDIQKPDLEEVRIIARDGNDGAFFVVDQFDPDVDLYKEFFGEQKQIYDASDRRYKFYNNTLGSAVDNNTVNKMYDNVPLLSAGQSFSGNRLMFSNYQEGRPNVPITANITVNNNPIYDKDSNYIAPGNFSSHVSIGSGLSIDVDALAAGSSWSALENPATTNTVVPAGTNITLGFDFSSEFIVVGMSLQAEVNGITYDSLITQNIKLHGPQLLGDTDPQTPGDLIPHVFNVSLLLEEDKNIGQIMTDIQSRLSSYTARIKYGMSGWDSANSLLTSIPMFDSGLNQINLRTGSAPYYVEVDWGFDDFSGGATSTSFNIKPYIKAVRLISGNFSQVGGGTPFQSFESLNLVGTDILNEDGEAQIEIGYSGYSPTFITSPIFSASNKSYKKGFKSGSSHTFGVVYYDKFNRSGNVNEIGTVYIQDIATRSSNYGPASVTVDLSSTTPPTWATSYQIVYPGPDTTQDFIGYTSGGAYYKRELSGNVNSPDLHTQEVYISLNSLGNYNEEKKTERDYSFTKGDKVRLISRFDHVAVTPGRVYDTASDGTAIEFDVVGVVTIGANNDFLAHQHGGGASTKIDDKDYGDFLILESPAVNSGALGKDGNGLKFPGYDWFSLTSQNYPDGSSPAIDSRWGQGTVFEVYTPRKTTSERVYFEIGEGNVISNGGHGSPIELTNGNVFFRPVACKTSPDAAEVNIYDKDNYEYRTFYLECDSASDRLPGSSWHKGRPHVVFEGSAAIRRYNGITYSDAYAEDVANLSLSSFNPSLANFFSLDSANGACNYIGTFRDDYLLAFQENRVARVPVGKDIITSPTTSGIVSLSTNVLNTPQYYSGDFGCGNNPESVLIRDGNAFFVDTSRKKLVRLTTEGLSPISEEGVDNMFKSNLDAFTAEGGTRIVSGYDPEDNQYYVTMRPTGAFDGLTLGYSVSAGVWQSRYTFYPDMYSDQNGTMYSAYYVQNPALANDAEVFHSHTNETDYNTFYGTFSPSTLKVVSNFNPSMVKVFNAISLENSGSARWAATSVVTDLGATGSVALNTFREYEGSDYASIRRDSSSNSTKHIVPIGQVTSSNIGTGEISFVNRVNTLPLMSGATVMQVDGLGNLTDIGTPLNSVLQPRTLSSVTAVREIQINSGTSVDLTGANLVLVTDQAQNGDPIRGHWAEITLTTNQASLFELYCVNTHFVQSKQDHSLGQQ